MTNTEYEKLGTVVNDHGPTNYLTSVINKFGDEASASDNYTNIPTKGATRMAAWRARQANILEKDTFDELRIAQNIYLTTDTKSEKVKGYNFKLTENLFFSKI